ncbi:hypothetical protein VNO78_12354 [Psophocarpus tetragonolobus]|uniref:Uncharacterized protein n=1 Tax=Psophocarpus tetragonolobus TaxID=3891 RepID=A0AAN9SPQ6_PSOTE
MNGNTTTLFERCERHVGKATTNVNANVVATTKEMRVGEGLDEGLGTAPSPPRFVVVPILLLRSQYVSVHNMKYHQDITQAQMSNPKRV